MNLNKDCYKKKLSADLLVKLGGSVKSFQPKTWLILIMICNQNLVSPDELLEIIQMFLQTHY